MPAAIGVFLFACVFVVVGFLLVYGAYRRWPFLVDPPAELSTVYSQAFIRKMFGLRATIIFTYCLGGAALLVGALVGIWRGFFGS